MKIQKMAQVVRRAPIIPKTSDNIIHDLRPRFLSNIPINKDPKNDPADKVDMTKLSYFIKYYSLQFKLSKKFQKEIHMLIQDEKGYP